MSCRSRCHRALSAARTARVAAAVKSKRITIASIGETLSAQRVAHRPQSHEGIEVLWGDLEPASTPLAERPADLEEVVASGCELVVAPMPVGLWRRLDDGEPF